MFPDSVTAQNLRFKRIKTPKFYVILWFLFIITITKLSKTENICILIDKSNDKEEDRCIVISVKIFNANTASFGCVLEFLFAILVQLAY